MTSDDLYPVVRRMKYVIHSRMTDEIAPFARRFQAYPVLFQVCRGVSYVLAFFAYLGALVAPAVVFGLPIQILRAFRVAPPSIAFWTSAALLFVCAVSLLYLFGLAFVRCIRRRVVHLEALVGFWCWPLRAMCFSFR